MATLPEIEQYDPGVYQIETTDPVVGGVDGIANLAAKALANRTRWLRAQIDALAASVAGLGSAASRNVGVGAADLPSAAHADARYAPIAHVGSGGAAHPAATTAAAGFMSAADKAKLEALTTLRYVSPDIDLVPGGYVELAHGLGVEPWALDYRLRCITADAGYAAGDVLDPLNGHNAEWTSTGAVNLGCAVVADETHIRLRFGTSPQVFIVQHFATGAITSLIPDRWRFIVRAAP